jgi:hypothetical protein
VAEECTGKLAPEKIALGIVTRYDLIGAIPLEEAP